MNTLRIGALLLFALPAFAQSITTQPQSLTVQVGQTAAFTVIVSGGPCRSDWILSGPPGSQYGATASTITFSIPNVTMAMNGLTLYAELYGCTGGSANLNTQTVTLTVVQAGVTVNLQIAYDDGTIPAMSMVLNQVVTNSDGTTTSTPVLSLTPDPTTGTATGNFIPVKTVIYQAVLFLAGVPAFTQNFDPNVMLTVQPKLAAVNVNAVFFKADGTIKTSSFSTQ